MNIKQTITSGLSGLSLGLFATPISTDSDVDRLYKQSLIAIGLFLAWTQSLRRGEVGAHEFVFSSALVVGCAIRYFFPENPVASSYKLHR